MAAEFLDALLSRALPIWHKLMPGMSIGRNCRIWPGTVLLAPVHIDDNVEIGRPIEQQDMRWRPTRIGANSRVRRNAVIYQGVVLGDNASVGHNVVVRERSRFGRDAYIKAQTYVGVDVSAGDRVTVAHLVGDRARLDDDATSLGALVHAMLGRPRGDVEPAPRIGRGAFVGRLAVVAGDVSVGTGAFVKAGAIVNSDVPDGARVSPSLSTGGIFMSKSAEDGKYHVVVSERRLKRRVAPGYLHAHFRSSERGVDHPVVVFSHGFAVDGLESHRIFLAVAHELNRRGYSTAQFDYPGMGWSDGEYVDFRLSQAPIELLTVVDLALQSVHSNGHVVIIGQSLGTAVAALSETELRDRCIGMALWNLSADIGNRYPRIFGEGIAKRDSYCIPEKGFMIGKSFLDDAARIDVIGLFSDWDTPVLFLNAGADQKSTASYADQAAERCDPSLVTRIVIEGANHSFKCQPDLEEKAIRATCDWIDGVPR